MFPLLAFATTSCLPGSPLHPLPSRGGAFPSRLAGWRLGRRSSLSRGWLGGVLLAAAPLAELRARPAFDAFRQAAVLTGTNVSSSASTVGATREPGEPAHAGNPGGASLWWTWTAPAEGWARLSTEDSSFDTLLGVYTGAQVDALELVAANDDAGDSTSTVRFPVRPGVSYRIAVDGFNAGTGPSTGTLQLSLILEAGPVRHPDGDDWSAAIPVEALPITIQTDNTDASREAGEPLHAGKVGSNSLWYRWQADRAGLVEASTAGSAFDTLLAVYTGPALGQLTPVAANDDVPENGGDYTSRLEFTATAGTTYWFAVDGYDGETGAVTLALRPGAPVVTRMSLEGPETQPDGSVRVWVRGPTGRNCQVEISGDLREWRPAGMVTLGAERTPWTETPPAGLDGRFYRGRLVP